MKISIRAARKEHGRLNIRGAEEIEYSQMIIQNGRNI